MIVHDPINQIKFLNKINQINHIFQSLYLTKRLNTIDNTINL